MSEPRTGLVPFRKSSVHGSCDTCAWWQIVAERSGEGFQNEGLCRRHAPMAVGSPKINDRGEDAQDVPGFITAWPRTFGESDWCGDHKMLVDIAGKPTLNDEA